MCPPAINRPMHTSIEILYIDNFAPFIVCTESHFWAFEHVKQIGCIFQIILFNIKAIDISGFTYFGTDIGENRSSLFYFRFNAANFHSLLFRQSKNICFLVCSEERIQRQWNYCINYTFVQNEIAQFLIIAPVHNTVRYNDKRFSTRFQSAYNPLHE